MNARTERRLLQASLVFAASVSVWAGASGMIRSAEMVKDVEAPLAIDLDSHFRYLSGLLCGIGIAFLTQVPRIEAQGATIRLLGLIVVIGGLSRLGGAIVSGLPGGGHVFGLAMELAVVPLLVLWQARVARRCAQDSPAWKQARTS